jgi:hypothetical protein
VKIRNKRGKMIKTLKPKNTIHKVVKTAVAALAGLGMLLNSTSAGCFYKLRSWRKGSS